MLNRVLAGVAVLAVALMFMGCEKKETAPTMTDINKTAEQAGAAAKEKAGEVASAVTEQAQKLLDEVTTYVKDKKWDLAEEALKKLDALKAQLPAEWAAKIDQARQALTTAKGAMAP
jgi:hypothetical protein